VTKLSREITAKEVVEQIGGIVMQQHADGSVEVLTTPELSLIADALLAELGPTYRDPADPEILQFSATARYQLGTHRPDLGGWFLHRVS
jgi:hypothetical protein